MKLQHRTAHCPYCARSQVFARQAPNHLLHMNLSLWTLGLWLPVWLVLCLQRGGWKCPDCGGAPLEPRHHVQLSQGLPWASWR